MNKTQVEHTAISSNVGYGESLQKNSMTQSELIRKTKESIGERISMRKISMILKAYQDAIFSIIDSYVDVRPIIINYPDLAQLRIRKKSQEFDSSSHIIDVYDDYIIDIIKNQLDTSPYDIRLAIDTYYDNIVQNSFVGIHSNLMSLLYIYLKDDTIKCHLSKKFTQVYRNSEDLIIKIKNLNN